MDAEHTVACVVLQADTWVDLLGDGLLVHEVYSCGLPAGWQRCLSPGDASSGSYLTCGFGGEDPHRCRVESLRGGEWPVWRPRPGGLDARPRVAGYSDPSKCWAVIDAVEGPEVGSVVVFGPCWGSGVRVRPRLADNILLKALKEWAEFVVSQG